MTKVYYTSYKDEKKQSQAGRVLLDFVLRNYYGIDGYTLSTSDNGKPYIEGDPVFFNISHSAGVVVLAVSEGPVGVDTEPIRDIRRQVIERFTGRDIADPADRVRAWIEHESYGKMTGEGIAAAEPKAPHAFHHLRITKDGSTHYVCVCTAAQDDITLCSVPLP
ncbi:MAG: hypothetical protein IJ519_06040 [Clostridia bacterium]|nr:hypothetical protein [Clostridia bacterium]